MLKEGADALPAASEERKQADSMEGGGRGWGLSFEVQETVIWFVVLLRSSYLKPRVLCVGDLVLWM